MRVWSLQPPFHNKLVCTYFSDFMVKEVVLDQPGHDQISIVPTAAQSAPCQRANLPNEIVLDSFDIFSGAKSQYLLLIAAETFGLEEGFSVFDARTGKKLFGDIRMKNEALKSFEVEGSGIKMGYRRVVPLECSLVRDPKNDGAACWEKTRRELHLDMPAPDCSAAYPRDAPDSAKVPSQIAYDVRAEWDGSQFTVRPVGSSAICGATP